ncbi:MAG: hypothetical protein AAGN82_10415 [Myxococcota bacterium]
MKRAHSLLLSVLVPGAALVSASVALGGCKLFVKKPSGNSDVKVVTPKGNGEDAGAGADRTSILERELDCADDLSVQPGARRLDTRRRPSDRGRTQFAAYHKTPPTPEFFLSAREAVDAVIDVETRAPTLLPAGYRERLRATPRDAALRLEVARCELDEPATRRRASYDAAMALLLGGAREDAIDILVASTTDNPATASPPACGPQRACDEGATCDPHHRVCLTEAHRQAIMISPVEFEIEHALSRGLLRPVFQAGGEENDLVWWAYERVHRCGGAVTVMCHFAR